MKRIKIITGLFELEAELNGSKTADKIYKILPLSAVADIWGEEVYFPVPVYEGLENGAETVSEGDMAYWPDGNAFCIFFGRTPVSTDEEIRPVSAVTPIGRVKGSFAGLKKLKNGDRINLEKA
ncbi:MAG: hypothetical protein JXJ19_07655 [Elusimicrobia bacterium]|nr:hypothetical protein [Elusimicrobiota bacterium]